METEAPRRAHKTVEAIALHVVHGFGAERAFVVGGSGAGKSTCIEVLADQVLIDYPTAPCLLLDTKPRFRAEFELNGASAAHRYKKWDRGATIPGSVALDFRERDYGMPLAHDLGYRTWILQDDREAARPLMLHAVERFYEQATGPRRPRLLVVDETLDFFMRNGYPVKGTQSDSLLRVARAGRERGVLAIFGAQRSVGIPPQLLVEATKVFLFRLDKESDIKVIIENGGMPEGVHSPERDRQFYFYDKRRRFLGFYKLRLPERAA